MKRMIRLPRVLAAAGLIAVVVALPTAPAGSQSPVPTGNGTITTLAGTTPGFAGDGGPANKALIDTPGGVSFVAANNFLIADTNNDRIRQVTPNGIINTVAGGQIPGFSGDGGPATSAQLDHPQGVTAIPGGGYLIADTNNNRIRRVDVAGVITTVAGGNQGFSGDGGQATAAQLNQPSDTALMGDGSVLIADTGNDRIRRIAPNGIITTIAGTTRGFGGDGGPAASAQLNQPRGVAVGDDGSILIADTGNNRIRRIAPGGTITTVAGGATQGLAGDGDPAVTAQLDAPQSVAALPHGGFVFADSSNNRVRRVTPLGAIFTVVGTSAGKAGDGGPANQAQLAQPADVVTDPSGGMLIADTNNSNVRRASDVGAIPPAVPGHSIDVNPVQAGTLVLPAGQTAFQPLLEKDLVPVGSQINANQGVIAVTSAKDTAGTQQTAQLFQGTTTVQQVTTSQGLVTRFPIPPITDCTTVPSKRAVTVRGIVARAAKAKHTAKKKSKPKPKKKAKKKPPTAHSKTHTVHGLGVSDTGGNLQTATGGVSASALGTAWFTRLTCAGTTVTVTQGAVSVHDNAHKKTVILRAGQSRFFPSSVKNAGH
jgi:sugar lactone lactonase YvrE